MNIKPTQFIMRKVILIAASIFIAGCSSVGTFNNISNNSKKNLRDSPWAYQYVGLARNHPQVAVNKPINMCEQRDVLYVKMHNHSSLSSAYFEDAVMVTLEDNELFHKIVTREPTVFINVDPYSPLELEDERSWYDTDDPLTVGQIRRMYPKLGTLVLEVRLQEFAKDAPIAVSLSLIDVTDGATVIYWRDTRNVWYRSMDMPTVALVDSFNAWADDVAEMCKKSAEHAVIEIESDDVVVEIETKDLKVDVELEKNKVEVETETKNHEINVGLEKNEVEVEVEAETEKHERKVKKTHSVLTPTIMKGDR